MSDYEYWVGGMILAAIVALTVALYLIDYIARAKRRKRRRKEYEALNKQHADVF